MKDKCKKFNYSKLRGRITEKFGTIGAFAEAYGITRQTMSLKLNGKVAISQNDIEKMSLPEFLDIQPCDYHLYFFTPVVHETQTESE